MVTLGIAVVISNALGAAGRGEQSLILLGISLVCLFTQVAGGSALVYLTPRFDGRQLIKAAYLWVLSSSVVFMLLNWGVSILPHYGYHIVILSFLNSSWNVLAFYLLGREKSSWYNALNFINSFIALAYLFIKWKLFSLQIDDYPLALYLSHGITLLISLFGLKYIRSGEKVSVGTLFQKFIHHGGFIQLANVAQLLKYRIHFYFIEIFLGTALLGIYANGVAVAEGVWIITRSLSVIQFSKVANLSNDQEARKITNQYTWSSIGLSTLATLVLLCFPDSLFSRIFGKEFLGIHDLLLYLSIAIISLSVSNLISHYFSGIGKNHLNFIGSLIGLLITAALGYILIPKYGLKGAAIASSVAFFGTAIFHVILYQTTRRS